MSRRDRVMRFKFKLMTLIQKDMVQRNPYDKDKIKYNKPVVLP